MITMNDAPVGWAMLMYDLDDAKEDLDTLMAAMQNDPEFDEECFRVRLGHIYWHLNRAWHRRNVPDDTGDTEDAKWGQFPSELQPL
jgi:hypothetical protein